MSKSKKAETVVSAEVERPIDAPIRPVWATAYERGQLGWRLVEFRVEGTEWTRMFEGSYTTLEFAIAMGEERVRRRVAKGEQ